MRNNYKLTPQVYKSILILAKSLGVFQRRDKLGNLIYQGAHKIPLMVNHEVNLVECYQKEGLPGIKAYAKFFEDLKKEKKDEPKQTL